MKRDLDNLSSDLEWMLQSEQVNDNTLAEHLAREYYRRIYEQCLDLLTYTEEARRSALETFITAVLSASDFNGKEGIGDWLAGLTENICNERVQILSEQKFLNVKLIKSILRRLPAREIDAVAIERAITEIQSQIQTRLRKRRIRTGTLELAFLALAVILILGALQFTNTRSATSPVEESTITEHAPENLSPDRTEVAQPSIIPQARIFELDSTNQLRGIPPQPLLSSNSSHDDIWRRLLLSRYLWETLWADVWVELSGPADYYGPPLVERHQLWIDQQNAAFHISGPPDGDSNIGGKIAANTPGPAPTRFLNGVDDYARLGTQLPWYFLSNQLIFNSPYLINLYFFSPIDFPPTKMFFLPVGEDQWIGLQTVIVHMIDIHGNRVANLWLEKQTGLALRAQYFIPESSRESVMEIKLAQLYLNEKFPDGIFETEEGSLTSLDFVQDYTARTELENHQPFPPPLWEIPAEIRQTPDKLPEGGIDPVQFPDLIFQPKDEGPVVFSEDTVLQIYADKYLLTEMIASDLLRLVCDRVPGGDRIAYSQTLASENPSYRWIRWANFANGAEGEKIIPGVTVSRLAISPDSRFLALAGIEETDGRGILLIIDMQTGELDSLSEVDRVWSLAWSPDGKQLATLKWAGVGVAVGNSLLVRIHDLETGRAVHVRLDEFRWGDTSLEVPIDGWIAKFPLPMLVVEDCLSPPVAANP